MAKVTLTEPTFILGSLLPAGSIVDINLADYGLKTVNDTYTPPAVTQAEPVDLAPNIEKPTKDNEPGVVEIAAIAPAGPNPTAPQAITAETVQIGETFVAAGDAITAEKTKGK